MQQRALQWIIEQAAAVYDEPFRPGSTDTVAYMLGRRSVGLAIIKLMKLSHDIFIQEDSRDYTNDREGRGGRSSRGNDRGRGRRDDRDYNNRSQRPRDDEDYREI